MTRTRRPSRSTAPKRKAHSGIVSRILETAIVVVFALALVYAASFTVKATQKVSRERQVPEISLRVQTLNGCGDLGCASKVAEALEKTVRPPLEVSVVDVDNFSVFDIEKSFLISRVAELEDARALAEQVGLSSQDIVYAPLKDNYRSIHVTLVVGKDYRAKFLN
ncbi:MAG: LytR C-terminal domain-containing protein [Candidatus Zixiibacteriota bacterium]